MGEVKPVSFKGRQIARPLKVLVPLIKIELERGDTAGHEHYCRAGEMLIEAKGQVTDGHWSQWLKTNFELSRTTAYRYIQWARHVQSSPAGGQTEMFNSIREMRGDTDRDRERRAAERTFRRTLREIARDDFVQERQSAKDEVELHREIARELVELGYRALATKLHPDRGGSKDAMARLNRVRDELKQVAQTRRFV